MKVNKERIKRSIKKTINWKIITSLLVSSAHGQMKERERTQKKKTCAFMCVCVCVLLGLHEVSLSIVVRSTRGPLCYPPYDFRCWSFVKLLETLQQLFFPPSSLRTDHPSHAPTLDARPNDPPPPYKTPPPPLPRLTRQLACMSWQLQGSDCRLLQIHYLFFF